MQGSTSYLPAATTAESPSHRRMASYPTFTIQPSPSNPFATTMAMPSRTKHRLSPSPSPHRAGPSASTSTATGLGAKTEMASPTRRTFLSMGSMGSPQFRTRTVDSSSASGSSPIEDSPTPACNISNAAARLRLGDDDSPVRRLPGHSRSLASGKSRAQEAVPDSPLKIRMRTPTEESTDTADGTEFDLPPQPLFTLPRSRSAEMRGKASESKIPRLSMSHPLRARASTQSAATMPPPPPPALAQKKAVSLDRLAQVGEMDEAFGSVAAPTSAMGIGMGHARKSSRGQINTTRHRRLQSSDGLAAPGGTLGISRSSGQKSGLSANLNGLPDFSTSNSSLSSLATSHMTPPASDFSPMPLPVFEDVRPLQEAFDQPTTTLTRKFKPRDSGVAMSDSKPLEPPPSVLRPAAYRTVRPSLNTAHLQSAQSQQTPIEEEPRLAQAGTTFGFLGNSGLLIHARSNDKLSMPDTPIKRQTRASEPNRTAPRTSLQPLDPNKPSEGEPGGAKQQWRSHPHSSPSGHAGSDSQSDPDNTPTKMPVMQNLRRMPAQTPMKAYVSDRVQALVQPRMSLPALPNPKMHRTLHHRQSHPATRPKDEQDDIFENRFILLETLGKGAFSTVVKVQDRQGEGLWAVKKARGVFDGVRDRLRHLEEVDILRLLSQPPNVHVLRFESAWEQNRQLFIQTELCLGTLAFFLEEYGRVVERLDEGRVWKIIRELSDGVHHIHTNGVVHFDLKPANILIDDRGQLKIGDFGLASRYPRVPPAEILQGSGLGGSVAALESGLASANWQRLDREGDRQYMPPEMLRGVYSMPADIFSLGVVILEVSTNICVPDGGPAWHALREDDFSVVDLSPISPALADLIMSCMSSDPESRPTIEQMVQHPVIVRARGGREALAPEAKDWIVQILGGGFMMPLPAQQRQRTCEVFEEEEEGDVEML